MVTQMQIFMYFLHLVLPFTPHYIIMVKGPIECCTAKHLQNGEKSSGAHYCSWRGELPTDYGTAWLRKVVGKLQVKVLHRRH